MLGVLLGSLLVALLAGAPAAQASVSVNDVQVSESTGGGALAKFTVIRTVGALSGNTTVDFATADGSAHAPPDYAPVSGSLFFGSSLLGGTYEQTVQVVVEGDRLDEPSESLRLVLSGSNEIADGEGTATITDDDPPPIVSIGDAADAPEGSSATFPIALNTASGRDVSVTYATTDGSAAAGQDYTPLRSGTVTIPAGSLARSVIVALLDDGDDEAAESFELRLSPSPTNATLGISVAKATILDTDEPPPPNPPAADPGSTAGTGSGSGSTSASPPLSPLAIGPPGTATSGAGSTSASPQLGLSSPRLRRPGTILVTVSCPRHASACDGGVTIFSRPNLRSKVKALRKERRLGRGAFRLEAGATRTLQIALSKTDRVLLQRTGRMNVRAFAVTEDAAGKSGVRRVTGTLIARTSHS